MQQLGVEPGNRVAVIGYGFSSFWARLARVKIVAEMPASEAEDFWLGDYSMQFKVIQAFADTGARVIVAEHVPGYARLTGWHRVNNTNFHIYLISS